MTEILTSAQMRGIERAAIESGTVTGAALMEAAGAGVVAAILAEWPDLGTGARRAVVLCGPGNNGGDGFVIARLLAQRDWAVRVWLFGDAAKLPADARAMYDQWCAMGDVAGAGDLNFACDVLVDAMFGTGLSRPVAHLTSVLQAVAQGQADGGIPRLVAVDVPTGLSADTGAVVGGLGLVADLTVTFHALKLGHVLGNGPSCCGKVVVVPIGLTDAKAKGAVAHLCAAPKGLDKAQGHKFSHGHAVVLAGGAGRGGAARMAAQAALRVGAGLVTLACPPDALTENAAQLTAVMLRVVDGVGMAAALADPRIKAICAGPALGLGAMQARWVRDVLASGRGAVLDADALTLVAKDTGLMSALHKRCVLTPHGGEFARLFPDLADQLAQDAQFSKLDATRAAAERTGCVVLFKGADTVIAAPDGSAVIHSATGDRAAPWLATAGAGDVLAGIITGLMARGADPFTAACNGAWLHIECACRFGAGLIASDLPDILPQVLAANSF